MAKKKATSRKRFPVDAAKFENIQQVGGIRTGTLDYPNPNGANASRVAFVNTGSGLRFVIALDRGGDIVEASFNDTNLAYLTQNDYKPADPAHQVGYSWLHGWAGGLVTTCGPLMIGAARQEDGFDVGLHGNFSNTPAAVEVVTNPDPMRGRREMMLSLSIRDTRMFGPNFEIRRQIQCALGEPVIHLFDEVINRGDTPVPHAWLYHVNLGYPLLDQGAKLIYRSKTPAQRIGLAEKATTQAALNKWKTVAAQSKKFAGTGEGLIMVEPPADANGDAHAGLINRKRGIALELTWPAAQMPRLGNWQHFGQAGSYVTGIEPFNGTLLGKDNDPHPAADVWIKPGESMRYQIKITVHHTAKGIASLSKHDALLRL